MNIAEWSIRKPLLTWTFTVMVMIAGIIAYYKLPRLEDPEFTIKEAQIVTSYPGASPRETAQEVTSQIEEAVQQMGQLKEIQSKSSYGLSIVRAEMLDKYNKDSLPQVWDELRNKIADSYTSLPPGASMPRVIDDYGDVYGAFYALTGKGATNVQLHEFAKYLQKQLLFAQDVKKIELFGVLPEALYVTLHREKMGTLGIAPEDIYKILKERNLVTNEGWVGIGGEWLPIKMDAGNITPEAIRNIVITRSTDRLITLEDIATVTLTKKEPPSEMLFFNGEPAVGIGISTVSGGNVVTMGESIQEKLRELEPMFPAEMKLHTVSMQSDTVSEAVKGFVENLVEAVVIVIVVLLVFMGLKSGLLIGFVLFLTICGTLFVMNYFQIALQRVSLGALIIALGMLVDNAIVITEGMMIRIRQGEDKIKAAREVVGQTMWPLLGATAIAVTAFGAIGLSEDSTGEFCGSLFYVLLISLTLSWITAITITPLLCYHSFRKDKAGADGKTADPYDKPVFRAYRNMLMFALAHKTGTVILMAVILVLSIWGFRYVDKNFFPASTRPQFLIDIRLPYGVNIASTNDKTAEIENYVKTLPEVTDISRFIGGGALRFILTYAPEEPDTGFGQLLVSVKDWREIDGLIERIHEYSKIHFSDVSVIPYKFRLGPGANGAIQARFSGNDPNVLRSLADQAMDIMRKNPNARAIYTDWRDRMKVIRPVFSEPRASRAGISEQEASDAIRENFEGLPIGTFRDGDELIPIIARADDKLRSIENFSNIMIWSPNAKKMIPLTQLFDRTNIIWEDPIIVQRDRIPTITVKCDPVKGLASNLFNELRPQIQRIKLPPGYKLEWGGEYEDSENASNGVFSKLPPFAVIMVLILLFMFNSVKQSLTVWLTVPLAMIGVTCGLLLTGQPFGFMALLGFLSLSGMLIKNAIILIDEINTQLKNGKEPLPAVVDSSVSRMRPVAMAAFTTVLGMLPLIFDAFFAAMAVTIMFGLTFACVLTLIVVPVLYAMFYRIGKTS